MQTDFCKVAQMKANCCQLLNI